MIRLMACYLLLVSVALVNTAYGDYTYKRPVTYAGPIVYSDEKPPVIQFPGPPPSNSYSKPSGYGGGYGDSKSSITYVPLPLDDLPILIYQSKDKPPVHVLNRPSKETYTTNNNNYGGSSGSYYNTNSYSSAAGNNYGSGSAAYVPANNYGSGYQSTYNSAPKPFYIGKPAAPSTVFLPQVKPNSYSGYNSGYNSGYGSYASGVSSAGNNGGGYSYNTAGNGYSSNAGSNSYYGGQVKQQPPHIVYSGHPPIHVYQQPSPSYTQPAAAAPPSNTYGSYGNSYGSGYSKPQGYANTYNPPPKQNNYVPAPPGYHKPPIIIYQGVKPPVHVYNEPSSSSYSGSSSGYSGSSGVISSGGGYSGTAVSGGYVGGYSSKNGEQWEPVGSSVQEQENTQQEAVKVVTFNAGDDEQEVVVAPEQDLADLTTEAESQSKQQKQESSA